MSLGARLIINLPWTTLGLTAVYSNPFSPLTLSLPSFPDSFRSPFAPPLLPFRLLTVIVERWYAATPVRSDMNTRDYSLRYCSSTSPFSTHHPTSPHLFLPLTTSEDILMITISNKGQEMQRERTKTEKEEEECPHVDAWSTAGSVSYNKYISSLFWYLVLYCFVVFCFLFFYYLPFTSFHFVFFFLECK